MIREDKALAANFISIVLLLQMLSDTEQHTLDFVGILHAIIFIQRIDTFDSLLVDKGEELIS